MHAALHLREYVGLGHAGDLHFVNLFDAVAGVRELVGQLTVVGNDNQPLARQVESADVEHPPHAGGQQVDHPRPACRIASGRDYAGWLVNGEVLQLGPRQRLAVDADFLPSAINAGAQLGDDLAVDLDAALGDELLALAAAGDAGGSEHFLEAFAFARFAGASGGRGATFGRRAVRP
jgi:hypothetical protein